MAKDRCDKSAMKLSAEYSDKRTAEKTVTV